MADQAKQSDVQGRTCASCGAPIEYVPGQPGSEWHTPFWRHVKLPGRPHGAVPKPR